MRFLRSVWRGFFVAGLICFALYYYVPAMLGMKSGRTSICAGQLKYLRHDRRVFLIPGILMGLLQIGWVAVIAAVAANFHHERAGPEFPRALLHHRYCVAWRCLG